LFVDDDYEVARLCAGTPSLRSLRGAGTGVPSLLKSLKGRSRVCTMDFDDGVVLSHPVLITPLESQLPNILLDPTNARFWRTSAHMAAPTHQLDLSDGASRIMLLPNAGGDSVASETFSFEYFSRIWNARLVAAEMQVMYHPSGGSMTDYLMDAAGVSLSSRLAS
jgi:hypothetical protein